MFMQNFIELIAAVHELSCWQREKNLYSAENNYVVATADSNNDNNTHLALKRSRLVSVTRHERDEARHSSQVL